MTDTFLTLGLYVFGILGGAYVGHEIANDKWKSIVDAYFEINERQILMMRDLRNQLAKFHTTRDKTGRFIKRQ